MTNQLCNGRWNPIVCPPPVTFVTTINNIFLYQYIGSASSLVVKSNVAIVEALVQLLAVALCSGKMNLYDRKRCWLGDRGRTGRRMNSCGRYGGDYSSRGGEG